MSAKKHCLRNYPKKQTDKANSESMFGDPYPLTNRHFEIFVDECKYWIKFFGLTGWEVNYVFVEDISSRAWICTEDLEDRLVLIGLANSWDIQPDSKSLRRSAFHEICELLTVRYYLLAKERNTNINDIIEENHNVIRTLENSVFQVDFNRRWPVNKKRNRKTL
jgi:hypothetical protein